MDKKSEVSGGQSNEALYSEVPTLVNGLLTKQELQPLQSQVAGHSAANGASSLGMLLHPEGYVMKPAEKKAQGENEIRFYQHLKTASDPVSRELRNYVPRFYGTKSVMLGGRAILCIVLENATDGMCEPCVMDIKIGKQTWEPSASEEKKKVERAKYIESKKECGFCIPGMQFYDITNGQLVKCGKEYGKSLDRNGVKDALKLFLNWQSSLSRPLILMFLCKLWKILKWFQSQRKFLFYSSSILFVYDAHRLQHYDTILPIHYDPTSIRKSDRSTMQSTSRFASQESHENIESLPSPVSKFKRVLSALKKDCIQSADTREDTALWKDDANPKKWVDVKMIDFAHTLISNESDIDSNYIDGLQSLVRMFEVLLEESY